MCDVARCEGRAWNDSLSGVWLRGAPSKRTSTMAQTRLVKNGDVADHRLSDADFLASFHLPRFDQRIDALQQRNPLPRESRIVFCEAEHTYTIDGTVRAPRSVTGLVHAYASHFDPSAAVECMRAGRNWGGIASWSSSTATAMQ